MYMLRRTDRPTHLAFWKNSNGHISATGHPIHFMFGSMVGFSETADRMELFPVSPNPRWRLGKFQMAISRYVPNVAKRENNVYIEVSGTADRMDLLPVVPNPRFSHLPSWKILNDHISTLSYPIHFHELQSSFGGIQEKIMCEG